MKKINTFQAGLIAAGLIGICTLLPWITIHGPFIGSESATGIQTDDGKAALVAAVLLGVIAYWANRDWLAVLGGVAAACFLVEMVHVANYDVASGATGYAKEIASAYTVTSGIGIWLGLLASLGLVGWALLPRFTHQEVDS